MNKVKVLLLTPLLLLAMAMVVDAKPPQDIFASAPKVKVMSDGATCSCCGCNCYDATSGTCSCCGCQCGPKPPVDVLARKGKEGCKCGTGCTCTTRGECGDKDCLYASTSKVVKRTSAYSLPPQDDFVGMTLSEGLEKSVSEGKPLCVWIGENAPGLEQRLGSYIHVHVDRYKPKDGSLNVDGTEEPTLLVGKPNGKSVDRVGTFAGVPSLAQIKSAVEGTSTASTSGAAPTSVILAATPATSQPVLLPAPPLVMGGCGIGGCGMPMMGGFGGGFGGGMMGGGGMMCGGGGCGGGG